MKEALQAPRYLKRHGRSTSNSNHNSNHNHNSNNNNSRKRKNNWDSRRGQSRRRQRASDNSTVCQPTAPLLKPVCSVCGTAEDPKYKCPKCRSTYCSIQCCRDHKAKGCTTVSEDQQPTSSYLPTNQLATTLPKQSTRDTAPQRDDDDDDLEEGWNLTSEMKQALRQSGWLRKELKDFGLQQIVAGIVAAPNFTLKRNNTLTQQEIELHLAKQNSPQFHKFLDKLLVLAGALEREDSDLNLEDWLESDAPTQVYLRAIGEDEQKRSHNLARSSGSQDLDDDDTTNDSTAI